MADKKIMFKRITPDKRVSEMIPSPEHYTTPVVADQETIKEEPVSLLKPAAPELIPDHPAIDEPAIEKTKGANKRGIKNKGNNAEVVIEKYKTANIPESLHWKISYRAFQRNISIIEYLQTVVEYFEVKENKDLGPIIPMPKKVR